MFKDKFGRKVIVEVKRGILSREASGQIVEYYGLLKSQCPGDVVELVLCANVIPSERRLFLENAGIDCKEVNVGFIAELAKKYNYVFSDSAKNNELPLTVDAPAVQSQAGSSEDASVWIFQANPEKYDILNALADEKIGDTLHWQINQHKTKIKKGHLVLIWMSGKDAGIYALSRVETDPQIMSEPENEAVYWDEPCPKPCLRVKMTVLKRLVNNPLLFKRDLANIDGLQNLSIRKIWRGTNFPVTYSEWDIISKLVGC